MLACQDGDKTHEECRRNAFGASRRSARVTVSILGYENWAVDEVSCRGHQEVRQGVREGVKGGQRPDPRRRRGGDRWSRDGARRQPCQMRSGVACPAASASIDAREPSKSRRLIGDVPTLDTSDCPVFKLCVFALLGDEASGGRHRNLQSNGSPGTPWRRTSLGGKILRRSRLPLGDTEHRARRQLQ